MRAASHESAGSAASTKASSYIVTGPSLAAVLAAVRTGGGRVTHQLGVIDAVAAEPTSAQEKILRADPRLTLTINAGTTVEGYAGATLFLQGYDAITNVTGTGKVA